MKKLLAITLSLLIALVCTACHSENPPVSSSSLPEDSDPGILSSLPEDSDPGTVSSLPVVSGPNTGPLLTGFKNPKAATPVEPFKGTFDAMIYADPVNGNDSNDGSKDAPYRTFQKALDEAMKLKNIGKNVRLILKDGTYREAVVFKSKTRRPNDSSWLVIEAENPRKAVVSGSEIWEGWVPDGGDNRYSAKWEYKFGEFPDSYNDYLAKEPNGGLKVLLPELAIRGELLFVDGELYTQVLSLDGMTAKTYYVDEKKEKIYLQTPDDWNSLAGHPVEVSVRDHLLVTADRETGKNYEAKNVEVRGIMFQNQGNLTRVTAHIFMPYLAAVQFDNPDGLIIDNCVVQHCNTVGLGTNGKPDALTNITITNSAIDNNGHNGLWSWLGMQNAYIKDTSISGNCFRLRWAEYLDGLGSGGFKFMHGNIVSLYNCDVSDNYTTGIWFDADNRDIIIDGCTVRNNGQRGIFIEYNQGPTLIQNCVVADTNKGRPDNKGIYTQAGISIELAHDTTIVNNVIEGNIPSQICIWPWENRKDVDDYSKNPAEILDMWYVVNTAIWNNKITASAPEQYLFSFPNYPVLNTLVCDHNTYTSQFNQKPFFNMTTGTGYSFEGWKTWANNSKHYDAVDQNAVYTPE